MLEVQIRVRSFVVNAFPLVLALAIVQVSCNHVFYHPDRNSYYSPDVVPLEFDTFSWDSPSGNTLYAWKLRSQIPKVGTVLHFYGNAQNKSAQFLFSQWFTEYGYDVVVFDYSGYGESTGKANRKSLHLDAVSVFQQLQAEGNIVVYCQSLGGAICVPAVAETIVAGILQIRQIGHLILENTFFNYRKVARSKLSQFWLTWPLQWPLSFLISSGYDPDSYAHLVDVPTTVVHGDKDLAVPLSQGQRLFELLGSSQKELWIVPGAAHNETFYHPKSPWRKKLIERIQSE